VTVDASRRQVQYRLSLRQLLVGVSVMAAGFCIFVLLQSRSWDGFAVGTGVWAFLVGANFATGTSRFESFLRRAIPDCTTRETDILGKCPLSCYANISRGEPTCPLSLKSSSTRSSCS
jgi:hypothetical protein